MLSAFRKPQRRLGANRRRDDDSDDEDDKGGNNKNSGDDEDSVEARRIALFKEKKNRSSVAAKVTKGGNGSLSSSASSGKAGGGGAAKTKSSLLSFENHFGEEDDGDVFQVKKSSQSRRLIKQKKADKKKKHRDSSDDDDEEGEEEEVKMPPPPQLQLHRKSNVIEPEMNMRFKDTLPQKPKEEKEWTLTGKEAEALHFEEDDMESDDDEENRPSEPHRDILRSGQIPTAADIYAIRKAREAARGKVENPSLQQQQPSKDFIPVDSNRRPKSGGSGGSRLIRDEDDADDSDEDRISFTGVKSAVRDRQLRQQQEQLTEVAPHSDEEEREDDWEEMQIRKAMKSSHIDATGCWGFPQQQLQLLPPAGTATRVSARNGLEAAAHAAKAGLGKPLAYNLEGIKLRLKQRLESQTEVFRRHQSDADRAVDELVSSQNEIERLESAIPDLADRHRFYQELRGYVTDLVECFDEKIVNIGYLEDKFNKSKTSICDTLMERRRQDVRDQMSELSSAVKHPAAGNAQLSALQEQQEATAEAARQRRAAEREGRRRRRLQQRLASQRQLKAKHNDGMSSDDELSTLEQANLSKARQDVENQARQVLSDVVEDFSTIDGVKEKLENWKTEDSDSYGDAYVSLCLPKIFSPLVRLQLLFWNPFAEHNDIDQMEWYKSLATYSFAATETVESLCKDADRNLVPLMVEKVVVPKITSVVKAAYDPMSTTQTLRVTGLIKKFLAEYPTLRGDSKQVRELLGAVKDKLKACIDIDPFIPIGYSKQVLENPTGGHANFVHRQFWSCFRLYRNTLAWHGILGDGLLADLALSSLLNRYLLIGLGMNSDPLDAIGKSKHVVAALPSEWRGESGICRAELQRFAQYLSMLGQKSVAVGRDGIQEIVNLLKFVGYAEESETVRRLRL